MFNHLGQPMNFFLHILYKLCQLLIYSSVFLHRLSKSEIFILFFSLNIPKWLIQTARTFYKFLLSIVIQFIVHALSHGTPSFARIQFVRLIGLTAFFLCIAYVSLSSCLMCWWYFCFWQISNKSVVVFFLPVRCSLHAQWLLVDNKKIPWTRWPGCVF